MMKDPIISPLQWPPSSLAELDLKYCQAVEVSGGVPSVDLYIVHTAGLLYHQDWMEARHLFRRSGELDQLRPWYDVAMAALKPDIEAVWKLLKQLYGIVAPPVQRYVDEIGEAFRIACLKKFNTSPPAYLAPILGFSTVEEMSTFARQWHVPVSQDYQSLVVAAGFLQSRLTTVTPSAAVAAGNKNDEISANVASAVAASS